MTAKIQTAAGVSSVRGNMVGLGVSHARGLGLAGGCGMHGLPGCKVENIVRSCADPLAEQHWLHLLRRCTCPVAGAAEPVQLSRNGKREVGVELGHPVHCAVSGGLRGKAGPCRGRRWWGGSAAWLNPASRDEPRRRPRSFLYQTVPRPTTTISGARASPTCQQLPGAILVG